LDENRYKEKNHSSKLKNRLKENLEEKNNSDISDKIN
jgi:hypothetical protein